MGQKFLRPLTITKLYIQKGTALEETKDTGRQTEARSATAKTALWFAVALLPGIIPLVVPVYEADVAALMSRPEDHGFHFWLSFGRPLLYPVMRPLMAIGRWVGFPAAAHIFAVGYLGLLAAWLWLLAGVLGRGLGSRQRGITTATILALHFHFYEIRLWSGSNVLLAGLAALAGTRWVLARHTSTRWWRSTMVAALATYTALNLHQSGAFLLPAVAALFLVADILHRRKFPLGELSRAALIMLAGFGAACVLYAIQMFVVGQTIGLPDRAAGTGNWFWNFAGFLKRLPFWAGAILPLPQELRDHPFAMIGSALVVGWIAWRSPAGLSTRRKIRAAGVVIAGTLGACLPSLLTDGSMSSRVLLAPLVGLWGGVALFLSCWSGPRWMQWAREAALVVLAWAMLMCHLWGFGLAVAVKHVAVGLTRQLHRDMGEAQVQPGENVRYHGASHNTRPIAWSDSGLQISGSSWGALAMLRPIFSSGNIPADIELTWDADQGIPLEKVAYWHSPLLFREHSGDWGVNGGIACLRQLEAEQQFVRPFRQEYKIGLGVLGACSTAVPAGSFLHRPFQTPENQFSLAEPKATARAQLVLTALDATGTIQMNASCRNLSPTVEATVILRWLSRPGELAQYEITPGATQRLDVSLDAVPGNFLVLEARGLNGPARVQFTRAEVVYRREQQP